MVPAADSPSTLWDVKKTNPLCFKSLATERLPEEKPMSYPASVLAKSSQTSL